MIRTAREIKDTVNLVDNKNVLVKIGAIENRNEPETVYIFISFWVKPKINESDNRILLEAEFKNIYTDLTKTLLENNKLFPNKNENNFIYNIPENFNYHKKKNFISIEMHLHTSNINDNLKIPLNHKKNTILFDECIKIANFICNNKILNDGELFEVTRKLKI